MVSIKLALIHSECSGHRLHRFDGKNIPQKGIQNEGKKNFPYGTLLLRDPRIGDASLHVKGISSPSLLSGWD
jgi:hypothetical protein